MREINRFTARRRLFRRKSKQESVAGYVKPYGKPMHPASVCGMCETLGANRIVEKRAHFAAHICYKRECKESYLGRAS